MKKQMIRFALGVALMVSPYSGIASYNDCGQTKKISRERSEMVDVNSSRECRLEAPAVAVALERVALSAAAATSKRLETFDMECRQSGGTTRTIDTKTELFADASPSVPTNPWPSCWARARATEVRVCECD